MAIPFIDRDPKQMIRYGKEAKDIVDQMNNSLRILEGVLEASKAHLDDNSQKQIAQLHTCCDNFRRESAAYRSVAEQIEEKGKKLLYARESGG